MKKTTALLLCLLLVICAAVPAAAKGEGFNAGVTISEIRDDSFTVTVSESSSELLAEKTPTLTVQCPEAWQTVSVTFDGRPLEALLRDHAVSFTVCSGGIYTISKGNSSEEDYSEEDEPAEDYYEEGKPADEARKETTAVTGEDGSITATVSEKDAESGKAVLPVTADSEEGCTVRIDIPEGSGELLIEIPVKDADFFTVAMLVNEDGTEEPLPDTVLTEKGIAVRLTGDAVLRIIDNEKTFTDVAEDHPARDAIKFAAARGLFVGVGGGKLDPDGNMSRAMAVTLLYRLSGMPEQASASGFSDVDEGQWYSEAIAWARESEIVVGYGDNTFGPDDFVTREQFAVMLWRLSGKPLVAKTETGAAEWAVEAMSWAVEKSIIKDEGSGYAPSAIVTRAEAAQLLMRYIERY